MARVTGTIALLAVALLVAHSYAYRTIVTTVEMDRDSRHQMCDPMSAREELRNCDQFLRMQMQGNFVECCRDLKKVEDEQCRCLMLEEISKEEQRQTRGRERKQMPGMAKYLTTMCGLSPQPCHF